MSETKVPTTPIAPPVTTTAVSEARLVELLEQFQKLSAKVDAKVAAQPTATAVAKTEIAKAAEIDWSQVNENQVFDLSFQIPVIEHELPSYMEVHLKDQNYVARWCNRSPRRLGPLMASGYEFVTPEHWDESFPHILNFDGEGHLIMDDVVLLRVHKSRYFSALRRTHMKSSQLNNVMGWDKVRGQVNQMVANDPHLEAAMRNKGMSFVDGNVESNIEEVVNI
jgi:hypothetical protein